MEIFGIINQSLVPVRTNPGDTTEMSNQLIYGELLSVKEKINTWVLIESLHDNYEGWIDEKQLKQINREEFDLLQASNVCITRSIISQSTKSRKDQPTHLTMGSRLYQFNDPRYNNMEGDYFFSGKTMDITDQPTGEDIIKTALEYLHSPYLWGGRSVWGIDCSGLVQMSYLLNGLALPRDASEQSEKGELVDFIHEIQPGDLAFFDNAEGDIIHVGIVFTNNQIIHANGKVRIDTIDHHGIYQQDLKKYSHKLRLIKRLI